MKASTVIAVAAGLTASIVSAQLDQIPPCALNCALSSLGSTGCGGADVSCICQANGFITSLIPCVQGACSDAEFETTIQAASGLCLSAGVTLSIPALPSATGSSTSAPSSTSAAPSTSSEASTETSETSSETSSAASTLSTEVSTTSSTATVEETTGPMSNGTVSTSAPTPTGSAPSSAGKNAVAFGGFGAIVALVAALL